MGQEWANNTYFDSSEYLAIKQYIHRSFLARKELLFFFFLSSRSGVDKGLICFLQSLFGNSHFFEKAKLNALRSEMNC